MPLSCASRTSFGRRSLRAKSVEVIPATLSRWHDVLSAFLLAFFSHSILVSTI